MSLYDDLGVPPDASADQISAAYRRKAKDAHPDKGGDPAQFAAIQHAVTILRDPDKRAHYDATGEAETGPDNSGGEIVQTLAQAFQTVMSDENLDLLRTDVIGSVRAVLTQQVNHLKREQAKAKAAGERAITALSRLRHDGDKPNVLGNVIRDHIAQIDKILAQMAKAEAASAGAIELAEEYSWQVEPPLSPQAGRANVENFGNGVWFTSGATGGSWR